MTKGGREERPWERGCQMPWVGNIAKTVTSNGKQFTIPCEMLAAVALILSITWLFFHLMTGPLGNSEFCFPRIWMFPSTLSRETLRFSGNKIHCSLRDQSLSVYCYIARLSLDKMSSVIGWFLVTCSWSNSNVSRSGYNSAVVARTVLCLFVFSILIV